MYVMYFCKYFHNLIIHFENQSESPTHEKVSILVAVELLLGHFVGPLGPLGELIPDKVVVRQFQFFRPAGNQFLQRLLLHFPQLFARFSVELQHVAIGLAAGIFRRLEVDLFDILVERLRKVTVLADVAGFLIAQLPDDVVRGTRCGNNLQIVTKYRQM